VGGGGSFDAADGGVIVFYEESFDSALGTFMLENGCGFTPSVWSNDAGYAHAAELATVGVSSIYSPPIMVPANVADIRLRLRHTLQTEEGFDGGQLLVSVNAGAATLVREVDFTVGPYVYWASLDPVSCTFQDTPHWFPAWSGNLAEFESEVNLSAAPFNVVAGDTVSIRFRMLVDGTTAGNGWDINWVRLTGRSP
jgi:hypothetical protein